MPDKNKLKVLAEQAMVKEFFGDEDGDQKRYWIMSDADLAAERQKNNVNRPSFYGSLIHDLLTTCAVLSERLKEANELVESAKAVLDRKKIVI